MTFNFKEPETKFIPTDANDYGFSGTDWLHCPVPRGQYMKQVITVFGSAAPGPGSDAYESARAVGRLLAEAGYAVATGGYCGTMTAVSQGAAEGGGHVIGVTSEQIERFRPLRPNDWVEEEIRYPTLRERLLHLVRYNDGMIALPGGIGTLSEVALAWNFLQVGEIEPVPLVLLGSIWNDTIHTFNDPQYIREQHLSMLTFSDTIEAAVAHLRDHHSATRVR
jgi:uncharacterized protein (TIGR00730 family)